MENLALFIRKELKKLGFTSKQISVRTEPSRIDTIVKIKIKDLSVPAAKIRNLVEKYKKIDRDQLGEILMGGNTFIDIDFDEEIIQKEKQAYLKEAKIVSERIKKKKSVMLENKDFKAFYPGEGSTIVIYRKDKANDREFIIDKLPFFNDIDVIAETLVILDKQYNLSISKSENNIIGGKNGKNHTTYNIVWIFKRVWEY